MMMSKTTTLFCPPPQVLLSYTDEFKQLDNSQAILWDSQHEAYIIIVISSSSSSSKAAWSS